jgi:hypothetical protein
MSFMYPIFATVLLCIPIAAVRYPLEPYEKKHRTEHELEHLFRTFPRIR